jgi:uncharacterized protein YkwD
LCVYFKKQMNTTKKIILWISILGASLIWSPSFSQDQKKAKDYAQKELVENLDGEEKKLAEEKFKRIIEDYWEEKWLELIQNTTIWNINKIRENNWLQKLNIDIDLSKAAQKYAMELSNRKQLSHVGKWWSTPVTRAKNEWYKSNLIWENLWKDFFSIQKAIERRLWSQTHKENIIREWIINIWVWYYNWYIVVLFAE